MKSLSLSGGGTKIIALAGASITLLEEIKYKPDIIIGTSAGSILSIPLAMGLYNELRDSLLNISLDNIFSIKPINKKGKLRLFSLFRILFGKESLGKQDNLIKTIAKIITEEKFNEYKTNINYPKVFINAVDFKTGARIFFDLKKISYIDYLNAVNAATSIPFFVESVKINNSYYYDGSIRDHISSHWLFENYNIHENISIYSRPEDYNITNLNWKPKNVFEVLTRTIDIMLTEISKNDELKEDVLAIEKNIKNTKLFMPYTLSSGAYDFSKEKLKIWYDLGKQMILDKYIK